MPDDRSIAVTAAGRSTVSATASADSAIHGARFHLACHSVGTRQSTTSHSSASTAELSTAHRVLERVG